MDDWGPDTQAVRAGLTRSGFDETYRPRRSQGGHLTWHLHGTRVELPNEGLTDAHLLAVVREVSRLDHRDDLTLLAIRQGAGAA